MKVNSKIIRACQKGFEEGIIQSKTLLGITIFNDGISYCICYEMNPITIGKINIDFSLEEDENNYYGMFFEDENEEPFVTLVQIKEVKNNETVKNN